MSNPLQAHKFRIAWSLRFHPEGRTLAELEAGDGTGGGADQLLITSMVTPPGGELALMFYGIDGSKPARPDGTAEKLDPADMFKAWLMTAAFLAEAEGLDEGRRSFAETVYSAFMIGMNQPAIPSKIIRPPRGGKIH